jgi:sugar lactone lactonase YvrE
MRTRPGAVTLLADGLAFPEAPRWHDGRLYFSDFYTHKVHALGGHGRLELICEVAAQPSGLGFDSARRLLIVSMADRRLLRLDNGQLSVFADLRATADYHLNDMLVDGDGRAYVGNFGSDVDTQDIRPTSLIVVDPDGTHRLAAEDLVFPNGMALTPDGATLLVAETFAHRVTAFDRAPDGSLGGRRVWADFGGVPARTLGDVLTSHSVAPDGIALDASGALWVADALGAGALRISEGGDVLDVVRPEGLGVFAVAMGGSDGRTLFMCAGPPLGAIDPRTQRAGCVLACRVDIGASS